MRTCLTWRPSPQTPAPRPWPQDAAALRDELRDLAGERLLQELPEEVHALQSGCPPTNSETRACGVRVEATRWGWLPVAGELRLGREARKEDLGAPQCCSCLALGKV